MNADRCKGCNRGGLYLSRGNWCATCAHRKAKGIPLDTPIRGTTAATTSRLPTTWFDTKPPRPKRNQPGLTSHALPDIPPIHPTPEATLNAARQALANWHATDLTDMLGLTPGAAA